MIISGSRIFTWIQAETRLLNTEGKQHKQTIKQKHFYVTKAS